ncbi:MAG: ATP-binding protein [Desulfobacterales bacterium]|nr:ATP-binding protein [Desulfobacterales bacterium]
MTISQEKLISLLSAHEWKDIEFKEAKKSVPKSAYESVSALANTQGGCLVFGVKKDGANFEIIGVDDVDKVQNDFLSSLRQKDKINHIIDVREQLFTFDGKTVMVIHVPEVSRAKKPVFLNGDIRRSFLRKGACDVRCSSEEVQRLISDASEDRYDSLILDHDIHECYNEKDILWYRRQYESKPGNRSYADLDDTAFLFEQGLIKDTEKGRKPTIASILYIWAKRLPAGTASKARH